MHIDINNDPRLSPTERMVLQQVRDRLSHHLGHRCLKAIAGIA